MDKTTLIGLFLGFAAIIGGQVLEGGHIGSILQPTAALIVLGGTFGATLLSYPMGDILRSFKMALTVFKEPRDDPEKILDQIVDFANLARRDGLIALDKKADEIDNALMSQGLRYMIDGVDPPLVRAMLENDNELHEEQATIAAKVFESAGGYSPTIGIIGAVLGLIHTMEQLDDPSKIGEGIAVAFVATVYGVGAANLLFLPIASKLKRRIKQEGNTKSMVIEGVLALQEGLHPRIIQAKLQPYLETPKGPEGKGKEE
ncbi:MAG: flagellar motor protein [Candidatus Tectomicrobia bacterium]|uniref:Flagellar motor protein n=1 Tax=Tectimicrobiota bacterium TaxID=2528274 RepID=A0A932G1T1_UNCTE|nr:flagellar motor protein [Candidatus Tectomicrobia bacterium]